MSKLKLDFNNLSARFAERNPGMEICSLRSPPILCFGGSDRLDCDASHHPLIEFQAVVRDCDTRNEFLTTLFVFSDGLCGW